MKRIIILSIFILSLIEIANAQDIHILFSRDARNMGKGPYTNGTLRRLSPPRIEISFLYGGASFAGTYPCEFYTVDRNTFTVIPISQVSQTYPNALTHNWLANYMKTTDIDVAASYLDNLPNIYIIEMLPALGVAHIHRVKYITPHH